MRKKAVAHVLAKMPGFKVRGAYYFGTCNEEVMAGYCIDAPPSCIRIWRFALPMYDEIDFLNLSLGKVVLDLDNDDSKGPDLLDIMKHDWADFSHVTDAGSLRKYLDDKQILGTSALWTRYLIHIWCKDFDAAGRFHDDPVVVKKFLEFPRISTRFTDLSEIRNQSGWEGCLTRLEEWRQKTKITYG